MLRREGRGGEGRGGEEGRGEIQVLLLKTTSCILFHFAAAYSCLRLSGSDERPRGVAQLASHHVHLPLYNKTLECWLISQLVVVDPFTLVDFRWLSLAQVPYTFQVITLQNIINVSLGLPLTSPLHPHPSSPITSVLYSLSSVSPLAARRSFSVSSLPPTSIKCKNKIPWGEVGRLPLPRLLWSERRSNLPSLDFLHGMVVSHASLAFSVPTSFKVYQPSSASSAPSLDISFAVSHARAISEPSSAASLDLPHTRLACGGSLLSSLSSNLLSGLPRFSGLLGSLISRLTPCSW